jgi:hypothetical protein
MSERADDFQDAEADVVFPGSDGKRSALAQSIERHALRRLLNEVIFGAEAA